MLRSTITAYCTLFILNTVLCSPVPGWHHEKKEHHIIHIPYKVHHIHHYHKVPVYIKSKPILIKEHHDHFHEHKHDHEHDHDHDHGHDHDHDHGHEHEHRHKHETHHDIMYEHHRKQDEFGDYSNTWDWDDNLQTFI